jgi:hypothetical protein
MFWAENSPNNSTQRVVEKMRWFFKRVSALGQKTKIGYYCKNYNNAR